MIRGAAIAAMVCSTGPATAVEVRTSSYVFVSDLSAQGFTPFGTGGVAGDMFGMGNGEDIYLCFLLDTPEDQATRQSILIAELQGAADGSEIPNIPVVCVLTQ